MKELSITKQATPAKLEDIIMFENENKICFPDSYREFLMNKNAVGILETLFVKGDREYWLSDIYPFDKEYELSFQMVYNNLSDFFENKYVAIANDAGDWQFVISIQEEDYGKIFFCRMDEELDDALTLLANTFEDFINGLEKPSEELA